MTITDPAALDALLDQLKAREQERAFEAEQAAREQGRLTMERIRARLREAHKDCDHANGRCERMDVEEAQRMLADKVAYYLRLQREAEAKDAEPAEPIKRVRKPSVERRIRQIDKAGYTVTAVQPDGTLTTAKAGETKPGDERNDGNEWDGVLQ